MIAIIKKYFPEISSDQQMRFEKMYELYSHWNAQINVISRKDIENLFERHILHSLCIAKYISFRKNARIIDVGTGGGFPGIPLAVMFPETHFHLIDGIAKKIKVVNEICSALQLKNTKAEQIRVENIKGRYDFIVSRAVTNLSDFYQLSNNCLSKKNTHDIDNGILYLRGGNVDEELSFPHKSHKIYQLSEKFEEIFFESKLLIHLN